MMRRAKFAAPTPAPRGTCLAMGLPHDNTTHARSRARSPAVPPAPAEGPLRRRGAARVAGASAARLPRRRLGLQATAARGHADPAGRQPHASGARAGAAAPLSPAPDPRVRDPRPAAVGAATPRRGRRGPPANPLTLARGPVEMGP